MARWCTKCDEYFKEAARSCHCGNKLIVGAPPVLFQPWYVKLLFRVFDPQSPQLVPKQVKPIEKLVHGRIYVFGISESGRTSTRCKICQASEVGVFSDCSDTAGVMYRCCLKCLEQLGGREQLERAASRSKHAKRWLECYDALNALVTEFPDPNRRPYGEVSLTAEMKMPFFGFDGIERVITKVKEKAWTSYDLGRINSEAEVPAQAKKFLTQSE
jgi:hypothetical protein